MSVEGSGRAALIGIDWGTTSFRAFRIAPDGTVRDRRSSARGILAVPDGRFGDTLREEVGPWLALGEDRILLSGMIGSRQGWREAPYLPNPAAIADVAAALTDIDFEWARVKLVPGLTGIDAGGVAEVMRGEETQIFGVPALMAHGGIACLPGTHSKWATVENGRIAGFATHMTGEAYAALKGHTILGRTMRDGPVDSAAFDAGLRRSADPGGLLHHIFGVRAQTLVGALAETDSAAYLSGILVGHEIRAAMPSGALVHVVGAPELTRLYADAIAACGGRAERHDGDAAAVGLFAIGTRADWG